MSIQHTCIKISCGKTYSDNEVDPYYCPDCLIKNKAIAKEVEAKIAARPKKQVKGEYQLLVENGSLDMGGGSKIFIRR